MHKPSRSDPPTGRSPQAQQPGSPRFSLLPLPGARASLEGLEVRDSTWDEWLACDGARRQPGQRQPGSVQQ